MQLWLSCCLSAPFAEAVDGAQFIANININTAFCFVYLMPSANLQVVEVAAWHVAPFAPQQGFS